ncbi:MAG TPA: hypothetical protein PK129_06050 [Cellvibrionaceae bacterium]|nr:hypothetical protein [Cellvibrionaceae bacterium]
MPERNIELIGEMPPYYEIADFLWGSDADIDSDGNSENPVSTTWNELTLILRSDLSQRVDIDPAENGYLKVCSENEDLLTRVIIYLSDYGAIK